MTNIAIMLGNLNIKQIEKRMGISFPDELISFMEKTHQSKAEDVSKGKWHCFDIPFTLLCGDMETAVKIYDYLKYQNKDIKESLQIAIDKNNG
jgi:hypothetical protein